MPLLAPMTHLCEQALKATSPNEPWLLIVGWLKLVLYGAATLASVNERCRGASHAAQQAA